ncbi:MAG: GNAT family N-acetyltransferase [Lachnospiraceae bacterium]|nr:GNAT family N-acetyltransferase [Lachnospiraceae bacterium]
MCLICDRIQMIKEGKNPYFVKELETGYVVLGIISILKVIHCSFPKYRGYRYMGMLIDEIEKRAKNENVPAIYISTNHTGLYEKYGYSFYQMMKDVEGEPSRVYRKVIV